MPSLVETSTVVLEMQIYKFRQCIFAISKLSPLGKRCGPSFVQIESSSPKDDFCQVWLKLTPWFWRRKFLNFVNEFLVFRNYLTLKKGGGASF